MNKIKKLRKFFRSFMIDGYLVPKNDEYFNEYVSQSNERLKFISNCLLMEDIQYKPKFSREGISQLIQCLRNYLRMF